MAKAKKLPSGSWRVLVYDGKDENGKRRYQSFTADTKKQAEYMAAQYAITHKAVKASEMTLAEAFAQYIQSKDQVLSPSTIKGYYKIKRTNLQQLMSVRLCDLTQAMIQNAINREAAQLSPKTVRNVHGLLSAVLSVYLPEMNLHTALPQRKRPELYIPSTEDVQKIIQAAQGSELEKAIMLAAFGSLRRSEIAALLRSDINGNQITVNKAMVRSEDHEWVIKQPKTEAGYRTITLPTFVIERISQCEERVVALTPGSITNQFVLLLERCKVPRFRFHDLRHYQASILHAMGVPDKYIIERGGWRTDSTLKNIYQHTMDEKRQEVEKNICDFFSMQHEMQHDTSKNT